ncbi:MAG: FeoC-like transcriptional regulator [Azovibrio sp.]|nr:FeoC-like transcriptional regulator [Azovibrio sp.]
MTPSQLRSYLRTHRQASLAELASRFDADPGLVQDVLAYWQQKGKVRVSGGCGKPCSQCNNSALVIYQWQE